jgi:hypothetical protein
MIGVRELLSARLEGFTLNSVWIHVLHTKPDRHTVRDATESLQNGFCAQILVSPEESIAGLDFASVHGLTAHIIGEDPQRCIAVSKQCKKHAGRTIVSGCGTFQDTGATQ